jgi:F-type H+-transporting ATPase subunit epsilon
MTIRCEIVSQDRTVFAGDVDIVVLPGAAGEMGILPKHAPVLTTLKFGVIKVRKGGKEEVFTVAGGIAEVQPDIVTVLADAAENVEEIDVARADVARARAEEALPKVLMTMMPTLYGSCVAQIELASRRRSSLSQEYPFSLLGTINPCGYVFQRPGH